MTDADLDRSYAAVRDALAQVGSERAELFLSMLCLALMARYEDADHVMTLIRDVEAQCHAEVNDAR